MSLNKEKTEKKFAEEFAKLNEQCKLSNTWRDVVPKQLRYQDISGSVPQILRLVKDLVQYFSSMETLPQQNLCKFELGLMLKRLS